MEQEARSQNLIHLPSLPVVATSAVVALLMGMLGRWVSFPAWLLAAEVVATVLSLFVFGSIRFRIDKNALAYSALLIIGVTFWNVWWAASSLKTVFASQGIAALAPTLHHYFFTLQGWDELVHADTMLFILGLTFLVAAVGETKLLEKVGFLILKKNGGRVFPTVALLAAVVSLASGVFDGVSMIGLMVRTLVVVLSLARAPQASVIYAVMMSTVVTTVGGLWLAYGEPPNLIMKANLHPHLPDSFFLKFCLPVALASYAVVVFNVRRSLQGLRIDAPTPFGDSADPALRRSQRLALASFAPFAGLLLWHALDGAVPLFWSSVVGAAVAFAAVRAIPHAVARAWREGAHECAEYLFLPPLFLSIALLQKTGFFDRTTLLLDHVVGVAGGAHAATAQFMGAAFLSAVLDNNVVADFLGRAIRGFELGTLHLFAMAQIAGYAVGGCWTHLGSAQSVVAYAFIKKNIAPSFTPWQWIRVITPVVVQMLVIAAALVYGAAWIIG